MSMASGDTLFVLAPESSKPPSANPATFDTIADASTPNTEFLVLDFDGATAEHADWLVTVPSHYAGTTGFTFSYKYAPDGATAGTVKFDVRVVTLADLDILTADLGIDTQTAASVTDTVPATPTDKLNVTATTALAKANMGTPAAGDRIIIRVSRDPATDTDTDDAQLLEVYVTET